MNSPRRALVSRSLALFALALAAPAIADPSDTVLKFMGQPVSLFSSGMDKLAEEMDEIASTLKLEYEWRDTDGKVEFDWATSQIRLGVILYTDNDPSKLEDQCKTAIERVRTVGGLNVETGKPDDNPLAPSPFSHYATLFLPTGYNLKSMSVEDAKALDALMLITVSIISLNDDTKKLVCTAPLLGTKYTVEN